MKILLDMNLSPKMASRFAEKGIQAIHWPIVGEPGATDREIVDWAAKNEFTIVTRDLDFSAILAV